MNSGGFQQPTQLRNAYKYQSTYLYMIKKPAPYLWLKDKIMHIPDRDHRAFIALTYGCFGRVGEVVRHKKDAPYTEPIEWRNPPIAVDEIQRKTTRGGQKIITIQVLTEKVNEYRTAIIYYDKEPWLGNLILRKVKDSKSKYLFNYSTRWGNMIFERYFKSLNIHALRHWRITHWLRGDVTGKPVPPDIVARLSGHTSLLTQARHYDHTVIEDYVDTIVNPTQDRRDVF